MTLLEQYEDAKKAYHALQTGTSARVVVDGADGSRVEYTAANRQSLYAYIQDLASQLGLTTISNPSYTGGPAGFVF